MEQYNEILKLKTMLEEAGIVFDFYPRKVINDECDGYKICYPAAAGRVCSVIEGALTHGGVCDICPAKIDDTLECDISRDCGCYGCKRKYWLKEIEEEICVKPQK